MEQEYTYTLEQRIFFPCEKTHFGLLQQEETAEFTDSLVLVVSEGTCLQMEAGAMCLCAVSQSCSCIRLVLGDFKEFY